MIDLPSLLSAADRSADFTTVVCFHQWAFGFVAYRDQTCVLLGDEVSWLHVPSWVTAVSFLALAFAEWFALKLLTGWIRMAWARRTRPTPLSGTP